MDTLTATSLAIVLVFLVLCAVLKSFVFFALGMGLLIFVIVHRRHQGIHNYYKFEDSKIDELKARIYPVIPEIQYITIYGSNKSFTINKKTAYICIKDSEGNYYPDNMLVYVILHELAHALCDEVNEDDEHPEKWQGIFKGLLKRAQEGGLYDPSIPVVEDYCGYNDA